MILGEYRREGRSRKESKNSILISILNAQRVSSERIDGQSGGLGVGGSNPLAPTNKIKGLRS
jgi:hypothetical protein